MDLISLPEEAAEWSAHQRRQGRTVGFIPTMGALHDGHISLVTKARQACGAVAASVFVNPLQFNNKEDLSQYPRQLEVDAELLRMAGCDLLFHPLEGQLFARFRPRHYDLGGLDAHWEGPSRPGHFQGVVNVVERLFHYVRPDSAFFGEKDRQQLAIIQYVQQKEHWPERIEGCPTLREADGLAMSSRNQRLDASDRTRATVLFRALRAVQGEFPGSVRKAIEAGLAVIEQEPAVRLDYLGIADARTLAPLADDAAEVPAIALIAAQVGPVRLIDNIALGR